MRAWAPESPPPPYWVGQDVYSAVVCYNTVEGAKKGVNFLKDATAVDPKLVTGLKAVTVTKQADKIIDKQKS